MSENMSTPLEGEHPEARNTDSSFLSDAQDSAV